MSEPKPRREPRAPDEHEAKQWSPSSSRDCSRRIVLLTGLGWGVFGCTAADGRGAGAPLSPDERQRRDLLLRPAAAEHETGGPSPSVQAEPLPIARAATLADLERTLGGRVGVYAFSSGGPGPAGSRVLLTHRADESFAMCSTFKALLAGAVLGRVDAGEWALSEGLPFSRQDLQKYAPVAEKYVAQGSMSLEAACAAAVTFSDNTAANLLLRKLGGPAALTAALRGWGDEVTRLDRIEPDLNSNLPGDLRDTTSPRAMATSLAHLLESESLHLQSRARLTRWLVDSTTGARRLRAGLPEGATVGSKTGTGNNGACHDVAVCWPSGGPALYVAAYLSESGAPLAQLEEALQRIGQLVAGALEAPLASSR